MVKPVIALSCSGEGLGHASRMVSLCTALQEQYHCVIWCPDSVRDFFVEKVPGITIFSVPLTRLIKRHNRVNVPLTIMSNLWTRLVMHRGVAAVREQFKSHAIKALIADYEPMTCLVAKSLNIPVIAFNHQGILDRFKCRSLSDVVGWGANRFMLPHFDHEIVSSFYNGDVGPLIRQQVMSQVPKTDDFVFVYAKPTFQSIVTRIRTHCPTVDFRWFPNPSMQMESAMAACKAVVAPAGHQLLSEALVLKKPIFCVPEQWQAEQQLNARMIEKSGWGMMGHPHTIESQFEDFMATLSAYPKPSDPNYHFCLTNDIDRAVLRVTAVLTECLNQVDIISQSECATLIG